MSHAEAAAKGERFARCAAALLQRGHRGDDAAAAVFVPGRIEVLGKHTDYCGGRSLLCTVERGMCFIAVPRSDRTVFFDALDTGQNMQFAIDPQLQPTARHWSNYPMTVVRRIARNFSNGVIGADVAMSSDLPAASGLSSSSAMIVGCFLVLSAVSHFQSDDAYTQHIRTREDLAGYLGCIENGQSFGGLAGDRGVGTFGGSQDHTAILCCKPGQLSRYAFCPVVHELDVLLPSELQFVIAQSGLAAEKTGDAMEQYNRVSRRARDVLQRWNLTAVQPASCLREISAVGGHRQSHFISELNAADAATPSMALARRLRQFNLESNELIPQAGTAIMQHDWEGLRKIVDRSQQHAERDLENQVPQTIALQQKLLHSGAIAASAFGAGFGGSVWGLFHRDTLATVQARRFFEEIDAFITRPGCAALQL